MSFKERESFRLQPGESFRSKWVGAQVTIERLLGEGANGSVYLARSSFGPSRCALKMGADAYSLQSEINALQSVAATDAEGGNGFILADDASVRGHSFSFYLMEYVPGEILSKKSVSSRELLSLGEQLLLQLQALHRKQWVFGDLKGDNAMIRPSGRVQLIDYGGATRFGRAVKQFTELYDRGYWKAGGRRAEPSYDLFSMAIVMLEKAYGSKRLRSIAANPRRRDRAFLLTCLTNCKELTLVAPVLKKMICGQYTLTDEAYEDWRKATFVQMSRGNKANSWIAMWFAGALVSFLTALWTIWS